MAYLVVLVGPPGSGKSTVASILEHAYNYNVVSTDRLRKELLGDEEDQSNSRMIISAAYSATKRLLEKDMNVVFDATNCRRSYRKAVLECLPDSWSHCTIAAVYRGTVERCEEQNQKRDRKVPLQVLRRMYDELESEPPNLKEGFDMMIDLKYAADIVAGLPDPDLFVY